MKRGDIVHGRVPKFSDQKHYFIVVYSRATRFCLLPITSKEKEWDLCFDGECIEISKIKVEEGYTTLKTKTKTSFLFLHLFGLDKTCCTDTDFKASDALLNKLRELSLMITND